MELIKKASKHGQMREKNLRLIVEHFCKGTYSTYTLGKMLGFSTGGAKKLVDEIVSTGVITKVKPIREYHQGRTPICYTINKDYQCIVIINYATKVVSLNDFCGNKIDQFAMAEENATDEGIVETADEIEYMLDRHKNCKLGAISIAYVGKFNEVHDHYYSGMFMRATTNLYEYFTERFGVKVIMHNDLNLSLVAKKKKGLVADTDKAACLLNIGRGVACSMFINGKLYTGATGLAGEVGNNVVLGTPGVLEETLMDAIGIRWQIAEEEGKDIKTINLTELIQRYQAGEEKIVKMVNERAYIAARLIRNIVQFLDFDKIIVQGQMLLFGDEYRKILVDSFYNGSPIDNELRYNGSIYKHVKLICTDEKEEDIERGAFEIARDTILDDIVYQWSLVPYRV